MRVKRPVFRTGEGKDVKREETMIPGQFTYHRPDNLTEAVKLLASFGDEGRALAGGHSLVPMMKLRLASPAHLVDLHGIAGSDRRTHRHRDARGAGGIGVREGDVVAPGARGEAAGDRHRALDRHVRHVGILAGRGDLAENCLLYTSDAADE